MDEPNPAPVPADGNGAPPPPDPAAAPPSGTPPPDAPAPTETFAILLDDDRRVDVQSFGDILAAHLGILAVDARILIRRARGIFLDGLTRDKAEGIAIALRSAGHPCAVRDAATLAPLLGKPCRIVQGTVRDDGFFVRRSFNDPGTLIPWGSIRLLCAGLIATPEYRDFFLGRAFAALPSFYKIDDEEARRQLKNSIAQKALNLKRDLIGDEATQSDYIDPDRMKELVREKTDGRLDLIVDGAPGYWRIDRREFKYDYLGPRAGPNSLENFRLLTADLVERATAAVIPEATRRYLGGADISDILFLTPAEFDRFNRWARTRAGLDEEGLPQAPEGGAAGGRLDLIGARRPTGSLAVWVTILMMILAGLGIGYWRYRVAEGRLARAVQIVQEFRVPGMDPAGPDVALAHRVAKQFELWRPKRDWHLVGWSALHSKGDIYEVILQFNKPSPGSEFRDLDVLVWRVDIGTGKVVAQVDSAIAYDMMKPPAPDEPAPDSPPEAPDPGSGPDPAPH